ncbi:MAG TPA: alkaline phosphatase family protein [Methylobacter sp.]|jgi:phospholipase C
MKNRIPFLLLWLVLPGFAQAAPAPKDLEKIQHIIVIYLENHSFDNLYGLFPGAEGITQATPEQIQQIDLSGHIYSQLPPIIDNRNKPAIIDKRFPDDLPNQPFEINPYVAANEKTGDLIHRFYQHQAQINSGKMNRFATISDAGGLSMGYYDGSTLPLWQYAQRFTLADHFFQAAFGGSFLNHQWLVCACTPRYDNAPDSLKAQLSDKGELIKDGPLTPDGYAVNTMQPRQKPYNAKEKDPEKRLPAQTQATIGDRLSEKKIDWAWYAGGWNDVEAGKPDESFQFHHQPFVYFQQYAEGSDARRLHLKDEADFMAAIASAKLPAVSFYKPIGSLTEHSGYADLLSGDQHIADILTKIEHSPLWKDSVIIVAYDEFGGFWDHLPPPVIDRWGPGNRVPAIIISPFAKRGYIDHTVYNTTSILKFIETRFGLAPLTERDSKANDLLNTLNF